MEDRAYILRQMKVCRFCLSDEQEDLTSIHEKVVKDLDISVPLPSLPLQVMACIALEVVKNDNMPQYICKSCRYLTAQAYIFKTNCKKADDALKLFLITGQLSKPYIEKVQITVQPVSEKTLTIPQQDLNEKPQASPVKQTENEFEMEFEDVDHEEPFAVEDTKRNMPSPVPQVQTNCYPCTDCESVPIRMDLQPVLKEWRHLQCCSACPNDSNNDPECSFFRFPPTDDRCNEWKENLGLDKLKNVPTQKCYSSRRVCSLHFEDRMFTSNQKNRLKRHAVPTIRIHIVTQDIEPIPETSKQPREICDERNDLVIMEQPSELSDIIELSFPLKQLLDLHMANHTRERNFDCEICEGKFFTKYDLQKHALTHTESKEFECVVCHKTFAREQMLRRHEKIHTDAPKYMCLECDKTFLTKEYLEFHAQKHSKRKPFTCNICNKSFVFKQGLERHEAIHNENKPFKCNYCEASFNSAIKLTRHITSHAGLRPYPCKLCGRTFLLSHHLSRHMRSHYAAKTSLESVGQHKCDICSMSFMKKDSLINHSAIHSMVNLKCVICNTTFDTANMVKEHITTHLSDLPFPCEKCDYSFETSEQLEEHEMKHAEMEYEDQIEKEVFSESMQPSNDDQSFEDEDEVEEGEVREFTILDINDPDAEIISRKGPTKKPVKEREIIIDSDLEKDFGPRVEFLKDEVDSETEQEQEPAGDYEDEVEEIHTIKPVIRQEGTKVYQRKATTKTLPERSIPARPVTVEKQLQQHQQQEQQANTESISSDMSSFKKMGDKVVKVQKFILTKDEMKAMAKQGILEVKNGQVVLKSGGQQILNATLKSIQKNEIDSLLDKRQSALNKSAVKRYEKKVVPGDSRQDN